MEVNKITLNQNCELQVLEKTLLNPDYALEILFLCVSFVRPFFYLCAYLFFTTKNSKEFHKGYSKDWDTIPLS